MAKQKYSKSAKFSGFFSKLQFWKRGEKKRPEIQVDANLESERMRLAAEIDANLAEAEKDGKKTKTVCQKKAATKKAEKR